MGKTNIEWATDSWQATYGCSVVCGNPAQSYDHWRGYDTPLDVQAVCFKCHGKRSVARGEHKLNGRKRAAKAIFGKRPLPDDLMVRQFPAETPARAETVGATGA